MGGQHLIGHADRLGEGLGHGVGMPGEVLVRWGLDRSLGFDTELRITNYVVRDSVANGMQVTITHVRHTPLPLASWLTCTKTYSHRCP